MGQIVSAAAKPKRCNKNQLSQLGVLAAGLHVLVSSDNSMDAAGQGNFDCYIVGDGTTAATALPLLKTYANDVDEEPTAGSDKLLKSGEVYDGFSDVLEKSLEFVKKEVSVPIAPTTINGIPLSNGIFTDGTGYQSLLYDISDVNYTDIVLKAHITASSFLTFLKSAPVVNSLMNTSDNVARHSVAGNSVVEFKIPYGTKYIVIDNRTNFQAQSVSFFGVDGSINDYLLKSEMEIEINVISDNIANPNYVIDGKYVNGSGTILSANGWSVIKLPVTVGKRYTFAGFVINRTNNNYAFYNGDTFISHHQYNPNENPIYTTEATPSGADYLYMTIKSSETGSNYDNLQVNEGTELKPYDEYKEGVVKIAGYDIASGAGSGGGTEDIQSLIADLPVSDGTNIGIGYAYIDSSTNVVKVKVL